MKPQTDLGLLVLRVGAGVLLMTHGIPKLMQLFAGNFQFVDPIGIGATPSLVLAVLAEFLFALLVVLGFKTRWTAIPPCITMLVAAFVVHGPDPFADKELALVYAVMYLALVFAGGGRYSFDGWWATRRHHRR